jgi:thiol-disulfide isomerase/thioredoxin
LLLAALAAGQTWLVFHLLRQNGRLLLRIETLEQHVGLDNAAPQPVEKPHGLPVGTPAPAFRLPMLDGDGGEATLETLLTHGKPLLLLFSNTGCVPCVEMLPEIAQWQRLHANKLTLALISRGEEAELRVKAAEHGLVSVLHQTGTELSEAYLTTGTPSAVLVNSDGTVASSVAGGATAIRQLLSRIIQPVDPLREQLLRRAPIQLTGKNRHATGNGHANGGSHNPAPAAPIPGDSAPAVHLPDLEGKELDLAGFQGRDTLLLFWNPSCGFCQRMLGDLREWSAARAPDAPHMVLISTGTAEANRAMELDLPILLDSGFNTGFAFGARGTPSAILVDGTGKIASPVVVGAPAVLDLAKGRPVAAPPAVA